MSDDVIDAGEELSTPTPAAPTLDPRELARTITNELISEVRREQQQAPQQRARKTEQVIAGMVADGASEEGIKAVLKLMAAMEEDRDHDRGQMSAAMQHEQFNTSLWAEAEDHLEVFRSQVPGFTRAQKGLVERVSEIFKDDAELAPALNRIKQGQRPTKQQWEKAANKAVDEYLDEIGAVKKRGPVEFRSSKPKPNSGGNFDPESGLDASERKLYLAYKNATGDEKVARQAVENMRKVSRGG